MKTAFGWLVLIGALAIPAVLFWKWWIAMQTTTTFEVKQKPPVEKAAFGEVKSAQVNPIETAALTPEAKAAAAAEAGNGSLDEAPDMTAQAQPTQEIEEESERGEEEGDGSAMPPGTTGEEEPVQAPPTVPGAVGTGGGSSSVRYSPKSSRDPMVSIFDLRELAKRRLAKELARRQVKRALEKPEPKKVVIRKPKPKPRPKPKPFCDTIELQGIIATPNGIAAIIDDEVRNEGDILKGAVIARITTRTVIFKKRRRTVCVKRVDR